MKTFPGVRTRRSKPNAAAPRIDLGACDIPLRVRFHGRAKNITLKVDAVRRVATVTLPRYCTRSDAYAFAMQNRRWIFEQLDANEPARPFCDGGMFPFRGVQHEIRSSGDARARTKRVDAPRPTVIVGGEPGHVNRRLTDWLKRQAAQELAANVDRFSAALDKRRGRIRIRDMSTRWGSCASDGSMAFCWRLIMAPPYVLEYVAAHECAHLIHMDHSSAFWRTVDLLEVDRARAKSWLDQHGRTLFVYGVQPADSHSQ